MMGLERVWTKNKTDAGNLHLLFFAQISKQSIFAHFCSFWSILGHFGPFGVILLYKGSSSQDQVPSTELTPILKGWLDAVFDRV